MGMVALGLSCPCTRALFLPTKALIERSRLLQNKHNELIISLLADMERLSLGIRTEVSKMMCLTIKSKA